MFFESHFPLKNFIPKALQNIVFHLQFHPIDDRMPIMIKRVPLIGQKNAIFSKTPSFKIAESNFEALIGNRQQATGNRQQATGNRQQATGNRQQATGNRQQ
ncbi:MAG: hypothetical protein FWD13_01685, partial [Treponema sp.]|nr:hypothetical protein [Treponema sp.]